MSNVVYADGVSIEERQMANSVTGFLDYYYEYDDMSGTVGAYYEEIINYIDPSGTYSYDYNKKIDIDDGNYYDDWTYDSWNWFEAGTGDGREGFSFYNYAEGWREYNDHDWNSLTGYFDIDIDIYLDTDLDGNWTDNYYTQFDEEFDVNDGDYDKDYRQYDYEGLNTGGAAAYIRTSDYENRYSGEFEYWVDQRLDTDGDGSWNDYSSWGDFGAYRTYEKTKFDITNGPENSTESWLYDSINRQQSYSFSSAYTMGDGSDNNSWFRWDADGDGSYSDDYYWSTSSWTAGGERGSDVDLYDYVSTYANSYGFHDWQDLNTGDFWRYEENRVDNDLDGDLGDYQNKGAYYSYSYSESYIHDGYSYSESEEWDPAGDYDAVTGTFGTYRYTYSDAYLGGNTYTESEYAKDTDKDGQIETSWMGDDLNQYSYTDFDADDLRTYSWSESSEDGNNVRGAYSYAWMESQLYTGSGEFYNNAHVENTAGLVETREGYDADDGESWSSYETRTWGVSRTYVESWSYTGGDFGVEAEIHLDTDANTAWDNQWDYEAFAESWDETYSWGWTDEGLAGGRYVGSYTYDSNTGNEFEQEFAYTSSGDAWSYYSYDGSTGNEIDQMLYYASGDLAGGAGPAFGSLRYDGPWTAPYTWAEYMYVGAANAWYLVDYNLL
jgi:hypothetical protein